MRHFLNSVFLAVSLVMLGEATADVVDDLGVSERELAKGLRFTGFDRTGALFRGLIGLPISDEHAAAIAAELAKIPSDALSRFHESRGDFAKALDAGSLGPLDRARLSLRAGRPDEARAALRADAIRQWSELLNPESSLLAACRPLEDAQAWDELREFLRLLSESLTSPAWRVALWAEELDVAWHLDRVPALLAETAGEPLRLAIFHHRLGNQAERDRLAAGLLENAAPARVAELLGLLRNSPLVRQAALKLWQHEDLRPEDRVALLAQLLLLPPSENVEEALRSWLAQGGDAAPLAELIWQRWSAVQVDTPQRTAVLAILHQRLPADPRFQFLLGRQLLKSDPAQAAELFEKVAALPLTAAPQAKPLPWRWTDLRNIPSETCGELPCLAICGLGLLDRQDRIRAVLDGQAGWAQLPAVDQARYLAIGGMDFALVKVVLGADFSKPGNDGLASWLKAALDERLKSRVLPLAVATEIAAKMDVLAAGSAENGIQVIAADAAGLLEVLGGTAVEVGALKECVQRLVTVIGKRDPQEADILTEKLRGVAASQPRLKEFFPAGDKPGIPANGDDDFLKGAQAAAWLGRCAPPQIRRLAQVVERMRFSPARFHGRLGGPTPGEPLNLDLLDRWAENFRWDVLGAPRPDRPVRPGDQAILQSLMRHFGAGNPRRLPLEILIAKELLACNDATLKAEAQANLAELLAGKKEARGTEAFRYVSLLYAKASEDELRKVLAELKSQPPAAQENFVQRLRLSEIQDRGGLELARRELGLATPPPSQPAAAKPDEDVVKLRDLERRNLTATPEAIELAKRLLDKVALRAIDSMEQSPDYSASRVLETTGNLDAWLKDAREKMRQAGIPEVEVLRRLQKIDQRQANRGNSRSRAYDREILALDPTDATAAAQLVGVAAAEGNRDLLLTCIRAMGAEGLSRLSQKDILGTFGKEDATAVLAIIREQKLGGRPPGTDAVEKLHLYFLAADPGLAVEFRAWLATRGEALPAVSRHRLAGQLLDAGRQDEAVEVIARAFVTPPEYPGFPYQFPPKPGTNSTRVYGGIDLGGLEPDLVFLRERNLFGALIARIEALGTGDPQTMATFRMAATPDVATFERHVAPILGDLEKFSRASIIQRWIEFFEKQPATAPLVLRLLEERAKGWEGEEFQLLPSLIQRAADLPGGTRVMAAQWTLLTKAAAGLDDPAKKDTATRSMVPLLRAMLGSADDDTWRSYWTWRETVAAQLGQLDYLPLDVAPTGFIDPARLRQVLPRVLKEAGAKLPAAKAISWAVAAVATNDKQLLEDTKALLPAECHDAADVCDLGLGDPMAVSPVLGATPETNGETLLWWNFVAFAPVDRESGGSDLPRCPFSALDGKFDLQLTAGNQPGHQVIVSKLSAVAAAGHVRLKLAPHQRYVAMVATEPVTGVLRWTRVIDVQSGCGLPLPMSDDQLAARGFERLAWNGPGGLPAWKIRFSGRDRVDLLERPWQGAGPFTLGAWVSGDGKLELRCLDAAGRSLQSLELIAWDSPIPVWQFRSIRVPEKAKIPEGTVRLVLSASVHGFNDGPRDFAISNVRMAGSAK